MNALPIAGDFIALLWLLLLIMMLIVIAALKWNSMDFQQGRTAADWSVEETIR